jgi:protein-S-isoprenylcysteine O-methyltransferase Ste14
MYAGFLLWIFGLAIYHRATISLSEGFIGGANILYWRNLEEAALTTSYGATYLEYRKRTWF